MKKNDLLKAFFTGLLSITPVFSGFTDFKKIDVDKDILEIKKTQRKPINVNLRPISEDVGMYFNDVGNKLKAAIDKMG